VIAVAAAILWAIFSFQMKRLPREIHPLATTACCAASGLVLLAALYLAWGLSGRPWFRQDGAVLPDASALLLVGYIAMGPSLLGNLSFTAGVQRVGAATAGALLYMTPVVATVLAVTVLGEALHLFHAVGIACIATGLVMATRRA
jgi:drug/metabolite transporter (DMT)-like permease